MARVDLSDTWVAAGDAATLEVKVLDFFNERKMRVTEKQDGQIHVKQGSQFLTRLLGGWFVPPSWFPKRAVVKILDLSEGVRIEASIEESLGLAVLDPIFKRKYQAYFETWMTDLKNSSR
jgi:hypothetical protein